MFWWLSEFAQNFSLASYPVDSATTLQPLSQRCSGKVFRDFCLDATHQLWSYGNMSAGYCTCTKLCQHRMGIWQGRQSCLQQMLSKNVADPRGNNGKTNALSCGYGVTHQQDKVLHQHCEHGPIQLEEDVDSVQSLDAACGGCYVDLLCSWGNSTCA